MKKLTCKMKTLYSELFDDGYVEVFNKEYKTAKALHDRGLIDLRRAVNISGEDMGMWEGKIIKNIEINHD